MEVVCWGIGSFMGMRLWNDEHGIFSEGLAFIATLILTYTELLLLCLADLDQWVILTIKSNYLEQERIYFLNHSIYN